MIAIGIRILIKIEFLLNIKTSKPLAAHQHADAAVSFSEKVSFIVLNIDR